MTGAAGRTRLQRSGATDKPSGLTCDDCGKTGLMACWAKMRGDKVVRLCEACKLRDERGGKP